MKQILQHFGFNRHPFGRHPMSIFRHRGFEEAFRRLLFTIELEAIAVLLADTGCGKSVLLGHLADTLQQQNWTVHYMAHSTLGPFGLINVLARKAGLAPKRSRGETAFVLAETLLSKNGKHLLVIDEAHELPDSSMEDLRLLTIADFDRKSPFILLLTGQPSLDERLADPVHYSLDQRITTVARLQPLSLDETREYIQHRLQTAGNSDRPIFDDSAVEAIFENSGGVPRLINNVATASLIAAAVRNSRTVSARDVQDAKIDRARL